MSFISLTGEWTLIPGVLKQIDHGLTPEVWGVNAANLIFRINEDKKWIRIAGSLKHVTTGEAGVWGVNKDDNIFFRTGLTWRRIPGKLKQIDSGTSLIVYGVNSKDDIFCRAGTV